jgi:hypothetical protein
MECSRRSWSVQDLKNRLRDVVAATQCAPTVTRHGKPVVVARRRAVLRFWFVSFLIDSITVLGWADGQRVQG